MSEKIINHVAIIMDGNGRWAEKQGKIRSEGHRVGAKAVEKIIESCIKEKISFLTLYAFSIENWNRSKTEIEFLMKLLEHFLKSNLETLIKEKIRLKVIGRITMLPKETQKILYETCEITRENNNLTLVLALSYGGRAEIIDATKRIAQQILDQQLKIESIDENIFSQNLYDTEIPDPDIMIRTSGEIRLSNFLTWQLVYSEFFFTPTLWPDFSQEEFLEIINAYKNRNRRFGGTKNV